MSQAANLESALVVRPVRTKHEFNGPIWLGFERFTCVPIQRKMCMNSLMSRDERQWLKVRPSVSTSCGVELKDDYKGA